MASNTSGAYPIDPNTQTGFFRTELGDIVASNIVDATADYEAFSDVALAAFLTAFPTSPDMALSRALGSWANQLIAAAQDIVVDDIKIKTVEKAMAMSARAKVLSDYAMTTDASSAFSVVPLVAATDQRGYSIPIFDPYGGIQGQPGIFGPSGF